MYFIIYQQTHKVIFHTHNSIFKLYKIYFYMNAANHRLSQTHRITESQSFIVGINLRVNIVKFPHLMNKEYEVKVG